MGAGDAGVAGKGAYAEIGTEGQNFALESGKG